MARTTLGAGLGYEMGPWRSNLGGGIVLESKRTAPSECNPDLDNLGCPTATGEEDPAGRSAGSPTRSSRCRPERPGGEPRHAGTYEQSYILLSLGVTYMF
jgi:hypothetical protein